MAHEIQRLIEESIPEAEDLLDRGLFTKDEVTAILAKRREFETRLHRFEAVKTDFLQYIEYELNLDKLREKRKVRLNVKRHGIADNASSKRINFIFDRAIRKLKGDLDLWVAAIEYAQAKRIDARISKLIASAVRLFPTNEDFWVMAASHEFETNKNMEEARSVMMQGIRVNPKSETLWAEYFRLEFLFLNQVAQRRTLLGIDKAEEAGSLDAALLKIVYRNAVQTLPLSVSFRSDFLTICDSFLEAPAKSMAQDMIEFILDDITDTFGSETPEVWREKAHRAGSDEDENKIYEIACKNHPSSALWEFRINRAAEKGLWSDVKQLCSQAYACDLLSEDAAVKWIASFDENLPIAKKTRTRRGSVDNGGEHENKAVLLEQLTEKFPQSTRLWEKRCELDESCASLALKYVAPFDSLQFWILEIKSNKNRFWDALKALARVENCSRIVEELVCSQIIENQSPSSFVSKLEQTVLNKVSLACYEAGLSNGSLSQDERRKFLERCVLAYPESISAWEAYLDFEKKTKDNKRFQQVLRRALIAAPEIADALRSVPE